MSENCLKHIENTWKEKTDQGNTLFHTQQLQAAIGSYLEALIRAETLNQHFQDCLKFDIPVVQLFIISCNNIANSYEDLGILEKADKYFRRSIFFLLHLKETLGKQRFQQLQLERDFKISLMNYTAFNHRVDKTPCDLEEWMGG